MLMKSVHISSELSATKE